MRETTDFTALFTPFELAGKQLRNRITHASMSLLATPAGRVTERLIQYHANRAAGGAALTVTEPLGMMRHQAGLPRVQVWRRDDADGLKRFADAVESQGCRLLGQRDAGRGRHYPERKHRLSIARRFDLGQCACASRSRYPRADRRSRNQHHI
jgi:2,4-dienoyl-CoA reductase-like NADH-dependent reductase (Old Yellow Enzyme family)